MEKTPPPGGFSPKKLDGVLILEVLRKHQDSCVRGLRADGYGCPQSLVGEGRGLPNVDDSHVGLVQSDLVQQFLTVTSLAHHVETCVSQDADHAFAHKRRGIGDGYAQRRVTS